MTKRQLYPCRHSRTDRNLHLVRVWRYHNGCYRLFSSHCRCLHCRHTANCFPVTFMSNMLYACSILYKTKLPFIIVFNKTDVQPHDFALDWMTDFEKYQEALNDKSRDEHGEGSYVNSLMSSMNLVLEEFYNNLRVSRFS